MTPRSKPVTLDNVVHRMISENASSPSYRAHVRAIIERALSNDEEMGTDLRRAVRAIVVEVLYSHGVLK